MEKLEVIKYHSPKKVLEYVMKNELTDMPGWEWVYNFVEADKRLLPYRRVYIGSRKEARFKFGAEVANSPKHALELDLKKETTCGKKELTQN